MHFLICSCLSSLLRVLFIFNFVIFTSEKKEKCFSSYTFADIGNSNYIFKHKCNHSYFLWTNFTETLLPFLRLKTQMRGVINRKGFCSHPQSKFKMCQADSFMDLCQERMKRCLPVITCHETWMAAQAWRAPSRVKVWRSSRGRAKVIQALWPRWMSAHTKHSERRFLMLPNNL